MLRSLFRDESGFIVSAELVLIGTLVVLGMITGLVCLRSAVVDELASLGAAFRGMNQTYYTPAFFGCRKWWGRTSFTAGSFYSDGRYFASYPLATEIQGGWGTSDFVPVAPPVINSAPGDSKTVTPTPLTPQPEDCPPPAVTTPCESCPPEGNVHGPVAPQFPQYGPDGKPFIPFGPSPQALPQF